MKVFVTGATGVIGRPLVGMLVARGDEVVGLTRQPARRGLIESLGARAVVADVLDRGALAREVRAAAATHLVRALTALPPEGPLRAKDLRATNVFRTEGTADRRPALRPVLRSGGPFARHGVPLKPSLCHAMEVFEQSKFSSTNRAQSWSDHPVIGPSNWIAQSAPACAHIAGPIPRVTNT